MSGCGTMGWRCGARSPRTWRLAAARLGRGRDRAALVADERAALRLRHVAELALAEAGAA